MSEEIVHSPKITLGSLSRKMKNRRNNYPLLAVTSDKIEYYFGKFIELLHGGSSPIRFEMAQLKSCIEQYFELITIFVFDNIDKMPKEEVVNVKRWLNILNDVGGIDIIPNKFTFFIPVLENNLMEKLPLWCKKEFLKHFSQIFRNSTRLTFSEEELKSFLHIVANWVKLLLLCGDYEFQTIIVETLLNACVMHRIKPILQSCFPDKDVLKRMFVDLYQQKDYVNDLKTFLTTINNSFRGVRSVPFTRVTLEAISIPPLKGMKDKSSWMHINYGVGTLSFSCQRDSLRSIPGSDSDNNLQEYEFVTINFEDIGIIALLINNDTETMNSTGGIFAINLTGQCSCRFSSSKPMVLSIKKIGMTLAPGDDLQFLKKEFVTLFGKRFKISYKIPIKGRNVSDKEDSLLQSSTQNMSLQPENKRRMTKPNDSTNISTEGNISTQNVQLERSWTLGNKENVSEDTKNYSLNNSGLRSRKSTLNERNETQLQSVNNEENRIANQTLKVKTSSSTNSLMPQKIITKAKDTKQFESVVNTESSNHDVKINSSPKVCSENKQITEDSTNCLSFSPDTIGHEFASVEQSNSKTMSDSFRAEMEIQRPCTTENDFSCLRNLDIDILTTSTSNNEVKMVENSEIFSPNALAALKKEELTLPSNYNFGEDNNLTISKENQSPFLRFINTQLNTIPGLESPFPLISKSKKIKTSQGKKANRNINSGIIDVSTINEATTSGYKTRSKTQTGIDSRSKKTISNSKNDVFTHVESESENVLQKSMKLLEITSKHKKETTSRISHKPVKDLPINYKKEVENRRKRNRGSDKGKTFKRVLHSSAKKASDLGSLENKQSTSAVNMNLEMPDSYALQNTEESGFTITTEKVIDDEIANKNENTIDNLETIKNEEIVEQSEYFSATPGDAVTVRQPTTTENNNLSTSDGDTVNDAESQYFSINQNVSPISDNSATPDLDFENKNSNIRLSTETVKLDDCHFLSGTHPEHLIVDDISLHASEERIRESSNVSVISISSSEDIDCFDLVPEVTVDLQPKINILSNIRVAPPLQAKINETNYLKTPAKSLARLPAKKCLLQKFNASQEDCTQSTLTTRISTERNLETLRATKQSASTSPEARIEILTPKQSHCERLATNETENTTSLIHQNPHEIGDVEGFHSFSSKKSLLNTCFTKEHEKKKMPESEKVSIILASKKRLSNEAAMNTTKKLKLSKSVHLCQSNVVNEDMDLDLNTSQLPQGELGGETKLTKEVESVEGNQKSKENSNGRLRAIHEEFDELVKKLSITTEGKTLNKKYIPMNFDDVQMETESDSLNNLIGERENKTGEAINIDHGETNMRNVDQRDEEYHKFMQENYSIEAMADALKTFLKTRKLPPKKNKKPQKKRILKFKLGPRKKGKSIIKGRVLYEPFLEKWGFR